MDYSYGEPLDDENKLPRCTLAKRAARQVRKRARMNTSDARNAESENKKKARMSTRKTRNCFPFLIHSSRRRLSPDDAEARPSSAAADADSSDPMPRSNSCKMRRASASACECVRH